jgi:peptidoglycan/xylan/chitin deacetylase (PgdA/CDA1 family)
VSPQSRPPNSSPANRRLTTRRLWATRMERLCRTRSVILGYHGIARSPLWHDVHRLSLSPKRFRTQLELLIDAGFEFITVAELARLADGGTPPPGYAAISFDDGMRNNLTVALPILQEYGLRATVYVTIGYLGGISPWIGPKTDNRMLSEEEVRDLVGAGWELGAHTMTHPDLSTLDYEDCRREIEDSKTALESIGAVAVETLAYPFGFYDSTVIEAARDSGLLAAVTTGSGSWAPYELTRAMISALDPISVVLLKLTDRYEPLLQLPPASLLRRVSKQARERVRGRRQQA